MLLFKLLKHTNRILKCKGDVNIFFQGFFCEDYFLNSLLPMVVCKCNDDVKDCFLWNEGHGNFCMYKDDTKVI
jgi:hypothetical protein